MDLFCIIFQHFVSILVKNVDEFGNMNSCNVIKLNQDIHVYLQYQGWCLDSKSQPTREIILSSYLLLVINNIADWTKLYINGKIRMDNTIYEIHHFCGLKEVVPINLG